MRAGKGKARPIVLIGRAGLEVLQQICCEDAQRDGYPRPPGEREVECGQREHGWFLWCGHEKPPTPCCRDRGLSEGVSPYAAMGSASPSATGPLGAVFGATLVTVAATGFGSALVSSTVAATTGALSLFQEKPEAMTPPIQFQAPVATFPTPWPAVTMASPPPEPGPTAARAVTPYSKPSCRLSATSEKKDESVSVTAEAVSETASETKSSI